MTWGRRGWPAAGVVVGAVMAMVVGVVATTARVAGQVGVVAVMWLADQPRKKKIDEEEADRFDWGRRSGDISIYADGMAAFLTH